MYQLIVLVVVHPEMVDVVVDIDEFDHVRGERIVGFKALLECVKEMLLVLCIQILIIR